MQRFSRDWRRYGESTYLEAIAKISGRPCHASRNVEGFSARWAYITCLKEKNHS